MLLGDGKRENIDIILRRSQNHSRIVDIAPRCFTENRDGLLLSDVD